MRNSWDIYPFHRAGTVTFRTEFLLEGDKEFFHPAFLRKNVLGHYPVNPGGFTFLADVFPRIKTWATPKVTRRHETRGPLRPVPFKRSLSLQRSGDVRGEAR